VLASRLLGPRFLALSRPHCKSMNVTKRGTQLKQERFGCVGGIDCYQRV
jgi:hypothetical protein